MDLALDQGSDRELEEMDRATDRAMDSGLELDRELEVEPG